MIAYANGRWVEAAAPAVPVGDAGFLGGHAVFETVRVYDARTFRLHVHLGRLAESARALAVPLPPAEDLARLVREAVARNDARQAVVRVVATPGAPAARAGALYIAVEVLPPDWRERARAGWRVVTSEVRHPDPGAVPPQIKTPGRLHGLLARLRARAAGADDALLLDRAGRVTEGPSWNVFWRAGDRLRTPGLEAGVLAGVTRAAVLDLAGAAGYVAEEGGWERAELDAADEVFATMTSLGVVPIRSLDGRELPAPGAAALKLAELYWRRVGEEAEPDPRRREE